MIMVNWQGAWSWLSHPNTQKTLSFVGGGIVAIVSAAWVLFIYLNSRRERRGIGQSATRVKADRGGRAAGGDMINNTWNLPGRKKPRK